LAHAARQASERGYGKFPIVDVDSHHYELESFHEILEYMEDPVLQQLAMSASQATSKGNGVMPGGVGYQDMGGDVAVMFPSPMLQLGLHPQVEVEVALGRAYNRWLCERVLAHEPRIRSMLYLPFNDPDAAYRMVKEMGDKKGVAGFMVTSARHRPVQHNGYMKTYALLEEMGQPLGFHAGYNWNDQAMGMMNK